MIDTFDEMADRRAIIFNDTTYSYADLDERIDYYSKLIREDGIESGSVVAINSDHSFEAIALFLHWQTIKTLLYLS